MEEKDFTSSDHTTVISPKRVSSEKEIPEEISFEGWDRYSVGDFLGQGATSKVYKAIDPSLKRKVALKFIFEKDSGTEKRFIREARAQAQIEHPHVCKIHEVGTFSGRHYIAMQFIEGETLGAAAQKMTVEQKVLAIQQVAEAVHTAHRIGIIHRDLKPTNIMVEKTDAGWNPYVLDFGLARETTTEGATVTGMVFGTPAFMPPEQAWGDAEKIDRRSDVYSLGATLYYILTHRAPYIGNTMEVILQLSQTDPDPVRKLAPEVPRDLETIVMKCLDRSPDRRYDSAKALADDLARFLNGDSIHARPATLGYKLQKKIRKHKTVAIIVGISSLVAIILGGIGLFSWWRAGQQIKLAQEFAQTAENMEWRMRIARMAPLHNITQDMQLVNNRIASIRERIKETGSIAEGPGHYAIGRGYMELSNFEQARVNLQKAWNAGYRTPENAYALGLTLGQLYQHELESAQQIPNTTHKEIYIKEIQLKYRQPALNYLRRSQGIEPALHEYVSGLIALYEEKYPEALEKSKSAQQKLWWLFEAGKLEGDARMALGIKDLDKGSYDSAAKYFVEAGNAYETATLVARSEPSLYESNCWRWLQLMYLETSRGGSAKEPMDQGLMACDSALKANPDSAIAYSRKAQMWWRWGDEQIYRGDYSHEAMDNSIRFAHAALERDPKNYYTYAELGNAYELKAEIENVNGKDPTESHLKAIEHLKTAANIRPKYYSPYNNIGVAYIALARYEMSRSVDPRPKLQEAIKYCKTATELAPEWVGAHNTLGNTYIILAEYERRLGIDSENSLKQAIASLNKAHQASPKHPTPFFNLAMAYQDYSGYRLNHGLNPEELVHEAAKNSEKCIELGGESYVACYSIMGSALLNLAKFKILQGDEPGDLLQKPIQYSTKTLQAGSNDASMAYNNLLEAYYTNAEYLLNRGKDPSPMIDQARMTQQKAMSELTDDVVQQYESVIEVLASRWLLKNGTSPEKSLKIAERIARLALEKNSNNASAHAILAEVAEIRTEWLHRKNQSAENVITEGLTHANKALKLNPSLSETQALLGRLHWLQSKSNKESKQLAIQSLQKAIQMNKNLERKYLPLITQIQSY
jgi:serine/threonine-protein kinase